ncbi:UDP-galactopyranose mutase [Geofilum rhodophaeum]|uniref:UDP-galactopyranose mutase n=1 Tax=Geofilum rhodophaeum TaxID=1965019 RepID=UPI00197AD968|nr:UDP-galactopyranose mutase [Geofilum rhodophaeum]
MSILIVGAGFSGSVIAEQIARHTKKEVVVIDERDHLGGNCYTKRDAETNVIEHVYGPHIFNTDKQVLWDYLSNFCELVPFVNRVKAVYNGSVYSLPINLHTINQFFNSSFNPLEAAEFVSGLGDKSIVNPKNFEEQALAMIGKQLYEAFFYGYTKKQWGTEPRSLPATILKRLPVRFNYNDNYYANQFQGIPRNGYTEIFERMLDHKQIRVLLSTKFDSGFSLEEFEHVFYTGPIDAFFSFKYGRLGYRTVTFERGVALGDYQGNAVINYPEMSIPYTRIHEHKHFSPWERHEKSLYFKEFSKETQKGDVPFYPKRLEEDMVSLEKYQAEAKKLKRITFLGRLATYRYLDMQHVVEEALGVSRDFLKK